MRRYQFILQGVGQMVETAWLSWLKVTVMAEGQHCSSSCEYCQVLEPCCLLLWWTFLGVDHWSLLSYLVLSMKLEQVDVPHPNLLRLISDQASVWVRCCSYLPPQQLLLLLLLDQSLGPTWRHLSIVLLPDLLTFRAPLTPHSQNYSPQYGMVVAKQTGVCWCIQCNGGQRWQKQQIQENSNIRKEHEEHLRGWGGKWGMMRRKAAVLKVISSHGVIIC